MPFIALHLFLGEIIIGYLLRRHLPIVSFRQISILHELEGKRGKGLAWMKEISSGR
jgi:hypothetical protein